MIKFLGVILCSLCHIRLIVEIVKTTGTTRATRPQEKSFQLIAIDKRFYRDMITQSRPASFIHKSKYVRVLLGSEVSINFISPGYYLCHVPGISTIKHIKKQALAEDLENDTKFAKDESCVVMLRRNAYLKELSYGDFNKKDVGRGIEELAL